MRNLYWWWESAISADVCDNILSKQQDWERARTGADVVQDFYSNHRRSDIQWMHDGTINDLVMHYITNANRQAFDVDISNYCEVQLTRYAVGDYYQLHDDVNWNTNIAYHRKLSFVLQLSDSWDYQGGDLDFEEFNVPQEFRKRGSIIVFPSLLKHQVKPIVSGTRHSLVAWVEGPKWR